MGVSWNTAGSALSVGTSGQRCGPVGGLQLRVEADSGPHPAPYGGALTARITLRVHSALDAVGLTASVARELDEADLSCNVVAGFHHDHLFVPYQHTDRAVALLEDLARRSV